MQLLILQELRRLRQDDGEDGVGNEGSGKKALARLHQMHDKQSVQGSAQRDPDLLAGGH